MKFKKLWATAAALCIAVSAFAGCGSSGPTKEVNGEAQETEQASTFSTGDTAVFDNIKITANEIKETSGTDFFKPEDGNTFVGINFTIENTSSEEVSISSLLLFEAYADDEKCDYSISATCAFDSETLDGSIAPGKKLTGWYAIEIPVDWSTVELQFKDDVLTSAEDAATFVFTK